MNFLATWESFSAISAPPGREQALAAKIRESLSSLCDEISTDPMGNLILSVVPASATRRVMLAAHMDEIGFMIRNIDGDGRLRLHLLGGYDTRVLSGRRIVLSGGARGIVAAKPIHVLSADDRTRPTPSDRLYIELGVKDRAEAETMTKLGDVGTLEPKFVALKNGFYAGKALGGRAGVTILCEAVERVAAMKKAGTLHARIDFVFSAKREIGRREFAIGTAAFRLKPDVAFVLDASPAADFGDATDLTCGCRLGRGVVVARADGQTIYDATLFAQARAFADASGIAMQMPSTQAGAGGEACSVQKSATGVRVLSLGIPTRNLHSGAEIVQIKDVEATMSLLMKLIESENC